MKKDDDKEIEILDEDDGKVDSKGSKTKKKKEPIMFSLEGVEPDILSDLRVNSDGKFTISGKVKAMGIIDWGDNKGKGRFSMEVSDIQKAMKDEKLIDKINNSESLEELDKNQEELEKKSKELENE